MTLPTTDSFVSNFELAGKLGSEPLWLRKHREQAFSQFSQTGFPTTNDEEWRTTSVEPIATTSFQPASENNGYKIEKQELESLSLGTPDEKRLVFINGFFAPKLSSLENLPSGLILKNLAEALRSEPDLVEKYLFRQTDEKAPFTALNAAFVKDGAFVFIPKGQTVISPIHLLFISTVDGTVTVSHPRNLIIAEEGSQATIVESYWGRGKYFTNAVTEIVVGDNASLDHIKIQTESEEAFHIATIQSQQGRASRFSSHSTSFGGRLARNDINSVLAAEGSECALNGLYMAGLHQQIDNHTTVDHAQPNSISRELYKGILSGEATGVFNGKIIVRQDAQKTDASQTNKNLLLSKEALINTKPQLEIFANDVKCRHGATIGQLDENAIFYLRSRGLGEKEARSFLTYAFASEMFNSLKITPLKRRLERLVQTRLEGPMS
ncbi:MAG: Fe-S cluster assembly protein SufD [Deltaproteobacteria bacterium]|nr:Fe-S cluster assembly protein SufD [Deltaproteobacteria bacterium]